MYSDVMLFIDGQWTKAAGGRSIPVVNPATGEPIGTVAHADKSDLDRALEAADKGFRAWRKVSALTDVPMDSRIMNEEPFGPVAVIAPFKNFDDVVTEANRLPYGLAAYAYTRSAKTAQAIAAAVETGMISINHHGLALPEVPFGGVKDSGYGSEGGSEAIEAYLNTKFVTQAGL